MTALTQDKELQYTEGVELPFELYRAVEIFGGSFVCVRADGYAIPGDDATGLLFMGVATQHVDNAGGDDGDKSVVLRRRGLVKAIVDNTITIANVGDSVYLVDDQTVDVVGNTTYDIFAGIIAGFIDGTHAWIDIEPAIRQSDAAAHIADGSAAHAASAISIDDAGTFTAQEEVEAALQEIYQHLLTAHASILVPLTALTQEDGTVLAKLNSTASGYEQLSDKEVVIDIPVNATIEAFQFTVPVPLDLDDGEDITVHVLAGKSANNDALTLDCEVFPCAAGDTANADIQNTEAVTITQAASELVFTCGANGVLAAPGTLTVVLTLGDTNDGDAVYIYGVWVEYTRALLAA